ncbi:MAG TPA: radical SAM protein [Anaeromyxobacter sp.]|nr:radical SAM protein [Anaeromyxobacter sp.]
MDAPRPTASNATSAEPAVAPLDARVLSHYPQIRELRRGGMPFPRTAILYPVYGCNLRCPACEYAADNEGGPAQLPLGRWRSLLDELARAGVQGVELCGGGEPLLHPGLVDAVLHGARAGLRFGLLTNGTLVSERFLAEGLPHFAYVRVTIDAATAETYAKVRPGPARWDEVLDNCRRLLAARRPGTEVSLKVLVDRVNRGELGAAVDLARGLGASSIQFKAARESAAALRPEEADEVERRIAALREAAAPFPVRGSVTKLALRRRCELSPLQTTIDARGDVFVCCYFTHRRERHRIGNVLTRPFAETWGSPLHRRVLAELRPDECSVFDCRFIRYHAVLDAWEGPRRDGLAFI